MSRETIHLQAAALWCSGLLFPFEGAPRSIPWLVNYAVTWPKAMWKHISGGPGRCEAPSAPAALPALPPCLHSEPAWARLVAPGRGGRLARRAAGPPLPSAPLHLLPCGKAAELSKSGAVADRSARQGEGTNQRPRAGDSPDLLYVEPQLGEGLWILKPYSVVEVLEGVSG